MLKRKLYVYHRPGYSASIHWSKTCPVVRLDVAGSRVIVLDAQWQEVEGLTEAPPSSVVSRAQAMFGGRACARCIPAAVLTRLS